ncbi:hypothetical protein [Sphaerisporangium sp. TRM90804]|uniref:hypothetical protein n=1 Tax=Sphaerisporangium sp. TRM90804 TaxID=3031113 RepID=UPI002448B597|nr:hypothetical protein [Sphaerisporangium sp. TRM90804]MDH2426467.1 hypothetical protein [Sphaerisporangium sp. TRM90804]
MSNRLRRFSMAVLTSALIVAASPAQAATDWQDGYAGVGRVTISGGHKDILLCDTKADRFRVGVEYSTSIGRRLTLQTGPGVGCVSDSIFLGSVTAAKFCYGRSLARGGVRSCNAQAWF